ncbi:S-adenosyl-L-methionine-dependent methyltransferase, partial [Glonium stellatum]
NPTTLLHPSALRRAAYSALWLSTGSTLAGPSHLPGPTASLIQSARGRVLEIGAGSGELIQYYDPQQVDEVVGIEPAQELVGKLSRNAKRGHGAERYRIIRASAEQNSLLPALEKAGLLEPGWVQEGVFDEIICVRVLCMVPRFEETVEGLWRLLKPGGRFVICEHGINRWRCQDDVGSFVARILQAFYESLGWSFWMGDCHLQRDIEGVFRGVGGGNGWSKVVLELVDGWSVLPYTVGYLVKGY